jgi:amino acid permease
MAPFKRSALIGLVASALLVLATQLTALNTFPRVAIAGFIAAFLSNVVVTAALRSGRGRRHWRSRSPR